MKGKEHKTYEFRNKIVIAKIRSDLVVIALIFKGDIHFQAVGSSSTSKRAGIEIGDWASEIRPPDDAGLSQVYHGRCHQHPDGHRSVQYEAFDEQKRLICICFLAADVGWMPRKCDIWKRKQKCLPVPGSRGGRVGVFGRLN